jgi:hypothetical protein
MQSVRKMPMSSGSSALRIVQIGQGYAWRIDISRRNGESKVLNQNEACTSFAAALRDGLNRQDLLCCTD